MNIEEINLGEGLGDIKFGMTREQVESILGKPDEVDVYSDPEVDDEDSESWHYDDLELSLSFDEESEWKLITIAVSSDKYRLNGKHVIGLHKEELLPVLESLFLGESETEDWSSEEVPNHVMVAYGDKQVNFWYEDDVLSEIQWGPLFIDDDTIRWPLL